MHSTRPFTVLAQLGWRRPNLLRATANASLSPSPSPPIALPSRTGALPLQPTRTFISNGSSSSGNGPNDVPFDEPEASGASRGKGLTEVLDESEVVGTEVDDLMTSFKGASQVPFSKKSADILLAPINEDDVEALPDGTPYLPEIKFRRILLKAFGPGGWGLVPRGKHTLIGKNLSREYALFIEGRFVSQARGEIDIQSSSMSLATAAESVRSDALKRCCKDIGIASELWDPVWTRKWKAKRAAAFRRY